MVYTVIFRGVSLGHRSFLLLSKKDYMSSLRGAAITEEVSRMSLLVFIFHARFDRFDGLEENGGVWNTLYHSSLQIFFIA